MDNKKRVFISYAREDRAHIKQLAASLENDGVDVWWDIETPPGKRFVDVIADALQSCDYVIVAWSPRSVDSDWVKREAATGLDRDVLLPILLEPMADLPFLFRDLHACSLADWQGESDHHEYQNLLGAIRGNGNQAVTNKPDAVAVQQLAIEPSSPATPATPTDNPSHHENRHESSNTKRGLAPFLLAGVIGLLGIGLVGFFLNQTEQSDSPATVPNTPPTENTTVTDASNTLVTLPSDTGTETLPDTPSNTPQDQNGLDYGQDQTPPDTTTPPADKPDNSDTPDQAATPAETPADNTASTQTIPYKVTAKPSLVLRDKPHRDGRKLGNAPTNSTVYVSGKHGEALTIGNKTGHWVQITAPNSGKTAYVFDAYLEAYPAYRITAKPSLTLRDKPSQKAKKLAALPTGSTVYPLATASGVQTIGNKRGKWVRIENKGKTGYIFDAFLQKVD